MPEQNDALIAALVAGVIVGPLARLILPGKQNISIIATILVGIIAAFVMTMTFLPAVRLLLDRRAARHVALDAGSCREPPTGSVSAAPYATHRFGGLGGYLFGAAALGQPLSSNGSSLRVQAGIGVSALCG